LRSLHTNDLLLALACADGADAAWKSFYDTYGKCLSDLSRHFLGHAPGFEELGNTIWVDLFLPDKSGQSRIASYDGRSSLPTWLRVVVSNRVINERQRRNYLPGGIGVIPEPKDPSALYHVESRVRLKRYQDIVLGAFRRAMGKLTDEEALIVSLRYDQERRLGEIARMFSVHQCTITRQIERLVERLRADVVALLASQYGLNGAQIDECMGVASETFASSVSILSFVRERARTAGVRS
jgi:RNA polymerase sigma factor (sigma-70 family)